MLIFIISKFFQKIITFSSWNCFLYWPILCFSRKSLEKNIVFNATDMKLNMSKTADFLINMDRAEPLPNKLWVIYYMPVPNIIYYTILNIIFHVIPGLIADGALKMAGQKPR